MIIISQNIFNHDHASKNFSVLVSSIDYKHVGFASASEWVPAFDRWVLFTYFVWHY